MKAKKILIAVILSSFFLINCNKEEMSVSKLLTTRLWNLESAELSGSTWGSSEMLNFVEPCGKEDILHFKKGGECVQMKNGCETIYGSWSLDSDESTLSIDNYSDVYEYEIISVDKQTLIIMYSGYEYNGSVVYLLETYKANNPTMNGATI